MRAYELTDHSGLITRIECDNLTEDTDAGVFRTIRDGVETTIPTTSVASWRQVPPYPAEDNRKWEQVVEESDRLNASNW